MTIETVLDTIALVLVLLGAVLCLTATIGLLRWRDAPTRLHAATKPQVLGVLLIVIAAMFTIPFLFTLSTALKTAQEISDEPGRLIPQKPTLENFAKAWTALPFPRFVMNTVFVTVLATLFQVLTGSLVAYGFARFNFKARNTLFYMMLATMMLPGAVTMIPIYLIWKETGLLGTWVPLWGMNLFGSAFYIFLQRQFFLGVPRELFEAARLDGCSAWGLFWRIAMPLSIPSFIIVFLFEFQASWNNLQAALIYLNAGSVDEFTAPLGIAYAMTKYSPSAGGQGDYQYVMVASLLVTLPMLIIFAFGQRYFVEGVATQGRKG